MFRIVNLFVLPTNLLCPLCAGFREQFSSRTLRGAFSGSGVEPLRAVPCAIFCSFHSLFPLQQMSMALVSQALCSRLLSKVSFLFCWSTPTLLWSIWHLKVFERVWKCLSLLITLLTVDVKSKTSRRQRRAIDNTRSPLNVDKLNYRGKHRNLGFENATIVYREKRPCGAWKAANFILADRNQITFKENNWCGDIDLSIHLSSVPNSEL